MPNTPVTGRSSLSATKRPSGQRQKRRPLLNVYSNPGPANARLISADVAMAVLTLEFDKPVFLGSKPTGWQTDLALAEVDAVLTAADTVEITFEGSVAAATEVVAPTTSNGIRTTQGGFGVVSTFPVGD